MRLGRAIEILVLFGLAVLVPMSARAQANVGVNVVDVVDDRISAELQSASLQVQLKLTGTGLDKVAAARLIVKEARDDRGTNLAEGFKVPDFRDRDVNGGALELSLDSPPRSATSFRVKGNVELFVPGKDPAAIVTVPKALARLDAPLSSPALTAAGIRVTPLSPERYAEEKKKQKITDKDLEEIRAQGKKHGASDKEIELAIGLAKAMDEMGGQPLPDNAVVLSASPKDFERIHSIDIIGPDKQPVHISSRETTTRGESAVMVLQPDSMPPAGAALRFTLLTSKARVSVPFELKKVDLP